MPGGFENFSASISPADIGSAVNRVIGSFASLTTEARVDEETRERRIERLREAHQNEAIPKVEDLADYQGEVCAPRERASEWVDRSDGLAKHVRGHSTGSNAIPPAGARARFGTVSALPSAVSAPIRRRRLTRQTRGQPHRDLPRRRIDFFP